MKPTTTKANTTMKPNTILALNDPNSEELDCMAPDSPTVCDSTPNASSSPSTEVNEVNEPAYLLPRIANVGCVIIRLCVCIRVDITNRRIYVIKKLVN